MKLADLFPIYKIKDLLIKRIVSLWPYFQIYLRFLRDFCIKGLKHQHKRSGICKNYNTKYCLTYMLEKWKNTLNKGKHVGSVFIDLSKVFDKTNHDLLIAKLEAYGFANNALIVMLSYSKNRSERVSISFSTWEEIITGAPQESVR